MKALKNITKQLAIGLIIPATIFAGDVFVPVTNSIINPAALTLPGARFGHHINGMVYQQDLLVTHRGWQYAAYYNADHFVCVSRRKLPDGSWEHAVMTDYTQQKVDSHNVVSMGICPKDGTIHIAFDHHVHPLHYRVSKTGVANHPESVKWGADLFGPITDELVKGIPEDKLTYPRFFQTPEGDLQFFFRRDYPTHGDRLLASYRNGKWNLPRIVISREGTFSDNYGTTTSRSGYPNPLRYGPDGTLHLTWTWREPNTDEPGSHENHDLMYIYSTDEGKTWKTTHGKPINGLARIDTPEVTVWPIPRGYGIINSNAETVDPQGRVHVVVRHSTDETLAAVGSHPGDVEFGAHGARRYHHYWRDLKGGWHHNEIPGVAGLRTNILFTDPQGNLYFGRQEGAFLQIFQAHASNHWNDWKMIHREKADIYGELLFDYQRWRDEKILSVVYQETPPAVGKPAALRSLDLAWKQRMN